jgi:predicted Na+-dependent transporter
MGSLGLSLTAADFKRGPHQPRGVLIGLANLFFLSPALAFLVAECTAARRSRRRPRPARRLPGRPTQLLTHLARGDTALSSP